MLESDRSELRAFLLARRHKIRPETVGLPVNPSRRARGLTRDEVAELAGVSVGWYAQLELGRPINISTTTLEGIARALRLDRHESRYLYTLAGVPPSQEPIANPDRIPNEIRYIVERYDAGPAQVLSSRFDVLLTNAPARLLFGLVNDETNDQYNIVYRLFTDPARRVLFKNWPEFAHAVTAALRHNYASAVGDPWFESLLTRLRAASPDFVRFWNEYQIAPALRAPGALRMGELGFADVTWSVFPIAESNGLQLAFTVPIDARSESLIREFLESSGELLRQHG